MTARPALGALPLLAVVALACAIAGCGRRIVVDPSQVEKENDRTWTVTSEPGRGTSSAPALPAPAPVATP